MASDNLEYSLQNGQFRRNYELLLSEIFVHFSKFFPCLDSDDKELVRKQVDMINKQLNMGVSIDNIVSDIDISSALQNSSVDVPNKVRIHI